MAYRWSWVTAAGLWAAASGAAAADVGRVLVAAGDVVAIRGDQTVRLALGAGVQERDLLRTGPASDLQVRFTDESILSLRSNSEIRVEQFRFSGREDGTELAVFRLLKGGLRTLTGLIGRTSHRAYSMHTFASSIGIRGTDYAVRLCQQDCRNPDGTLALDGLYGRVLGMSHGTNRIDVRNERDERVFGIDENFFVADMKSPIESLIAPPHFLSNRLESRRRAGKPADGASGSESAAAGSGAMADGRTGTPPAPLGTLDFVATHDLQNRFPVELTTVLTGTLSYADLLTIRDAIVLTTGQVTQPGLALVSYGDGTNFPSGRLAAGLIVDTGSIATADGGIMSFGRWTGATSVISSSGTISPPTGVPYILGTAGAVLPAGGTFSYRYAGGPRPVDTLGLVGSFNGGTFIVTFGAGAGGVQIDTKDPLSLTVGLNSFSLTSCTAGCTFAGTSGNMTLNGVCTGASCLTTGAASASVAGTFTGPQSAGLAISGNVTSPAPVVSFSAGFARQ